MTKSAMITRINCYEMILRVTSKIDILIWKSENYQLKEAE
jgi:hypothetical protein